VTRQGGEVIAYAFVIELAFLKGRAILESDPGPRIEAVLTY
jgi:adenine/guanine phosphoribosyltransferase-like PRPP-binding protein